MTSVPNAEQKEFWAREGEEWVRQADRHDGMNARFDASMRDAAALRPGERVLGVGCGNGATSIEAVRRAGPTGAVVGVGISPGATSDAERGALGDAERLLGECLLGVHLVAGVLARVPERLVAVALD